MAVLRRAGVCAFAFAAAGALCACRAHLTGHGLTETQRRLYLPTEAELAEGFDRYRPRYDTQEAVEAANRGCASCHRPTDSPTMHPPGLSIVVACVDCHGGHAEAVWTGEPIAWNDDRRFDPEYLAVKQAAHVAPRYPEAWSDPQTGDYSSANPVRSYTLLNYEDPEFIRFVNPGDLRVAHVSCGPCHMEIVQKVRTSMMTHGAQLWQAALYNNGSYPSKIARFGESYSVLGVPQRLYSLRKPSQEAINAGASPILRRTTPTPTQRERGVLDALDPLPRWEITQMGNILRAFERGGKIPRQELELGLPNIFEEPGKPDMKLSDRGLGTQLATDPVFLNIQKTRLLDPVLSFLGTNDHSGDYRSSGCTACHVVYANDRDPLHSGKQYVHAGPGGRSATRDPTIAKNESGHPIRHEMTRSIPSSQCVVCHMHPGTSFANTYYGFHGWDNETHGELMYAAQQRYPTAEQYVQSFLANPEGATPRGLWSDLWAGARDHLGNLVPEHFLEAIYERLNPLMDRTQFADFHGHGWIFRAVFKQDRKGHLLDVNDEVVESPTPEMLARAVAFRAEERGDTMPPGHPVHLKDIHLERGMHCVDCHYEQDVHGDGLLYGEVRNAIEIDCIDCHGTIRRRATLISSGPPGGNDLNRIDTPFGPRFQWRGDRLIQQSAMEADLQWEVPQIADSVNPNSPAFNARAAYAKLLRRDGSVDLENRCPADDLAHDNGNMTCYACHTAWMTSCFGCHLPMRANMRMPMLHNEGEILRNYTTYNFQVVRDDVFMLGRDSTVKGGRVAPVRSSSAVIVGSANANREWIYSQQQTISSEGYSGQAFNPHFMHAVRKSETRRCTDCHLSEANDNNAWMAQVLLHGTNLTNFLGRFIWVGLGRQGLAAVVATERDEPQAVIGSSLHRLAYPDDYERHVKGGRRLNESYEHAMVDGFVPVNGEILDVQMRGEYLYTARGRGGFYAYDIANIDNKGFSERIVTAPVSPFGQRLHVPTGYATAVATPSTLAVDPTRTRISNDPSKPRATGLDPVEPHHVNQEQPIHPVYAYLYVSDREEGLVVIGGRGGGLTALFEGQPAAGVSTLLDGDPMNNFLHRETAFNPDGLLDGAEHLTLAGHFAYVCCDSGLVVVDLDNPREPRVAAVVGRGDIKHPRAVAVQFRYAFVTDAEGLKVVDVTEPTQPRPVDGARVPIADARRLYLARTYAYVAGGAEGLHIIDIENPEKPVPLMTFDADGQIDDARDVKVGMTNASAFAYVADGRNGLRVLQLTDPQAMSTAGGFSPTPQPRLIATYPTHGPALAVSEGLDRDRAVDETGHQVAVFGRLGSRPFTWEEQRRLYLRSGPDGSRLYRVDDEVPGDLKAIEGRAGMRSVAESQEIP